MSLEWNFYKLKDLINLRTGKLDSNAEESDGDYPFFTCAPDPLKINSFSFNQKAILLAGNNANGNFHINYYDGKFDAYQRTYVIDVLDKEKINLKFLYYALKICLSDFKRMSQGTSTRFLTKKILDNFEVQVPQMETQWKIVEILDSISNKIKINQEINKNLYGILLNYFNEIFDHKEKNCKLSDIVNIRRGASPRPIKDYISDAGINWLKISDVTGTEMPFIYKIKEKIIEKGKSKSVFIEKGTLVVSNSATPGIPKFIMVDTCVHDGWLVLNEYEDNLRYYLYFLIVKIRRELINLAYGSVFNNLKTDTLKNYEISKPTDDQLDKFNKMANPIMEKIDSNTKEIMMLSKLRDTLLPKLMSGEIDVSQINCDLDEPVME